MLCGALAPVKSQGLLTPIIAGPVNLTRGGLMGVRWGGGSLVPYLPAIEGLSLSTGTRTHPRTKTLPPSPPPPSRVFMHTYDRALARALSISASRQGGVGGGVGWWGVNLINTGSAQWSSEALSAVPEPLRCFLIVSPRPSSPAFYSRLHVHQGEREEVRNERERERRDGRRAKEFLTHG